MNNNDFFDDELRRVEEDQRQRQSAQQQTMFDGWNSYQPQPTQTTNKRGWVVSLICLVVVLSLVMGWVLCALFNTHEDDSVQQQALKILQEVMSVVDNDLYPTDMADYKGANGWSESAKNAAIAAAGTAMLQTLGDQYSRLMSPEQYYTYLYGATSSTVGSAFKGLFGIQFSFVDGVGLYVSNVVTNGAAYGRLQSGDIIYKFELTDNADDVLVARNGVQTLLGKIVSSGQREIVLGNYNQAQIEEIMSCLRGANFYVLRNGVAMPSVLIMRAEMPTTNVNLFNYVEYYFDENNTNLDVNTVNISPKDNNGNEIYHWETATSAYQERRLDLLPSGVGYVRLTEFSGDAFSNVDSEFVSVMQLFKASGCTKLVLDLKGNPGGNVLYASNLAGRLVYNFNGLSNATSLFRPDSYLITTLIDNKGTAQKWYNNTSSSQYYNNYVKTNYYDDGTFDVNSAKKSIVVWTDGNSASASELVTGALVDYGAAVQMGTTTYGKGIAQTVAELTDYTQNIGGVQVPWAVYYTVDKYYTPADTTYTHNLHGVGLIPTSNLDGLQNYQQLWTATAQYWK